MNTAEATKNRRTAGLAVQLMPATKKQIAAAAAQSRSPSCDSAPVTGGRPATCVTSRIKTSNGTPATNRCSTTKPIGTAAAAKARSMTRASGMRADRWTTCSGLAPIRRRPPAAAAINASRAASARPAVVCHTAYCDVTITKPKVAATATASGNATTRAGTRASALVHKATPSTSSNAPDTRANPMPAQTTSTAGAGSSGGTACPPMTSNAVGPASATHSPSATVNAATLRAKYCHIGRRREEEAWVFGDMRQVQGFAWRRPGDAGREPSIVECPPDQQARADGLRSEPSPEWWNGRHAGFKIPWALCPCGFESHLRYLCDERHRKTRR